MLRGIAGGIGAGKSVVSRILRLRGFGVYDCDCRAKEIMDNDEEILSSLHSHFGESVVNILQRKINRAELASIVFSIEEERLWLNELVHDAVRRDIMCWHKSAKGNIFVESAIIVESGLAGLCSEVWYVDASAEVRIARVLARNPELTLENIQARIRSQESERNALYSSGIPIRQILNDGTTPLLPQLPDNID